MTDPEPDTAGEHVDLVDVLSGPEAIEGLINAYTHAEGQFAVRVAAAQLAEAPFTLGVLIEVNETEGVLDVDEAKVFMRICTELEEVHHSKLGTNGLARLAETVSKGLDAIEVETARMAGPKH